MVFQAPGFLKITTNRMVWERMSARHATPWSYEFKIVFTFCARTLLAYLVEKSRGSTTCDDRATNPDLPIIRTSLLQGPTTLSTRPYIGANMVLEIL